MRIWLHCVHTSRQRVFIFSPDTDVATSYWSSRGTAHTQQSLCHPTQQKSGGFSKFPSPSCFVAGTSRRPRFVQHPTHPSVIRLVGCAYFRSHSSAFVDISPVSLYHSLNPSTDLFDTHKQWLTLIRKAVWLRADNESQNVPTMEALRLHWYRCLWVLGLWHSVTENEFELPCKLN